MNMVREEDIAEEEEEDYSSDDIEDSSDDSSDDDYDDDDIEDDDDILPEVDSIGNAILSEDYLMRSYIRIFNIIKKSVGHLDEFSKSGPSKTLVDEKKGLVKMLECGLQMAHQTVNMLLEKVSQGPKRKTILQMHGHATTEVAAIKAKFDELG